MRRAVLTQLNSPHPSPLPVRRGEGEGASRSLSFLNSTAVHPDPPLRKGRGGIVGNSLASRGSAAGPVLPQGISSVPRLPTG